MSFCRDPLTILQTLGPSNPASQLGFPARKRDQLGRGVQKKYKGQCTVSQQVKICFVSHADLRAKVRPDKSKVGPAVVQLVQVASEMARLVRHGLHRLRNPRVQQVPLAALATGCQDACGRRLNCSQAEGCWMWLKTDIRMVETCGIN